MILRKRNTSAQSTIEFALILPIVVFLLSFIIYVFRAHHISTQGSIVDHQEALEKFDHGNGFIWDENLQAYVPEGGYEEFVPPDALFDPSQLVDTLVPQLVSQLGLDELFARINFLNGDKFVGAFARGFTYSAASSYISSDFTSVDWDQAAWQGLASGFASSETTLFLQGSDFEGQNLRELLGSGAQSSLVSFAQSGGELQAGLTGVVSGMVGSDSTQTWMEADHQIVKAAVVGAVESSARGVINGDFDVQQVARSAGLSALNTDKLAQVLPFTSWSGGKAKDSAFYRGINSGLTSLLQGGDSKSAIAASLGGALSSQQVQKNASRFTANVGLPSSVSLASASALQSSSGFTEQSFLDGFGNNFQGITSVEDANRWIETQGFESIFPLDSNQNALDQVLSLQEKEAVFETLIMDGYLSSFPSGGWS
ncbi:MAG: pilus assembly protein [Bdellovibrionales bacterium]|nr:pilus assembly protein [Bdellovibrionales bacterium]